MKIILHLFIVITGCYCVKAQVAIELPKMNVIYIGLENPIHISVEGYKNDQLRFTTSEACSLRQQDSGYFLQAKTRGECVLHIESADGKFKTDRVFRVRPIPKPSAKFGTLESGRYTMGSISAQPGIYASLGEGFAYEGIRFNIVSYNMYLLHEDGFCHYEGKGTRFPDGVREKLSAGLMWVIVTNIKARLGDGEPHDLEPLIIFERDFGQAKTTAIGHDSSKVDIDEMVAVRMSGEVGVFSFYSLTIKGIRKDEFFHKTLWYDTTGNVREWKEYYKNGQISKEFRPGTGRENNPGSTTGKQGINYTFNTYWPDGRLKSAGILRKCDDTLSKAEIGHTPVSTASFIIKEDSDTCFSLEQPSKYYPYGEWNFYHENGTLKASGAYGNFDIGESCCEGKCPGWLIVYRSGTWVFNDDKGKLLYRINYH